MSIYQRKDLKSWSFFIFLTFNVNLCERLCIWLEYSCIIAFDSSALLFTGAVTQTSFRKSRFCFRHQFHFHFYLLPLKACLWEHSLSASQSFGIVLNLVAFKAPGFLHLDLIWCLENDQVSFYWIGEAARFRTSALISFVWWPRCFLTRAFLCHLVASSQCWYNLTLSIFLCYFCRNLSRNPLTTLSWQLFQHLQLFEL